MTPEDLRRIFHPSVYRENAAAQLGDGEWDFSHFLREGLEMGLSPTPYFDPAHVRPGPDGEPALLRWIRSAASTTPHPLVDHELVGVQFGIDDRLEILARLTAGDGRLLRLHPLFWGTTYLAAHPRGDSIRHPLHHYLGRGWRRGHEPNPFFVADLVEGGDAASDAPALRWLRSADPNAVPTMLFDPMHYGRVRRLDGTPRSLYLDFLSTGVQSGLSPSRWFDEEVIRSQVASADEPAAVTYLRVEHQLDVRPCASFDPADHQTLLDRSVPFGARILERFLSPRDNRQFRPRPIGLSESVNAQLDRLAIIAPEPIAELRNRTDRGRIRLNSNDFTSPRLAVLRRIESLLASTESGETLLLLRSGQATPCAGVSVDLDLLSALPDVADEDIATALVEIVRERRSPVVIACALGDRILSGHVRVLIEWVPLASAWPRTAEEAEDAGHRR